VTVRNMVTITVNGKPRELEGVTNLADLLEVLAVNPKQVAVAVNGEVVRRVDWAQTEVAERDSVEIVRAVGGGGVSLLEYPTAEILHSRPLLSGLTVQDDSIGGGGASP